MLKNDSVVPLYQQVADDIKHRIETSEYVAGQMIPSETKLCEMYQVSRITVRNAISMLVEEEILVKRHGKGTFVQNNKIPSDLLNFSGFTTTWKKKDIKTYTHVISITKQNASKKIAQKLQIPEDTAIIYLKRLRYANDHAVILEHVYLPYEKYKFLFTVELENESLYSVMAAHTGFNPEHSCNSITTLEACNANSEEASLLELNDSNVVVIMGETVVQPSGEVVHYTKQVLAACHFKFSMFNRGDMLGMELQN